MKEKKRMKVQNDRCKCEGATVSEIQSGGMTVARWRRRKKYEDEEKKMRNH